jgi:hypothetical protein
MSAVVPGLAVAAAASLALNASYVIQHYALTTGPAVAVVTLMTAGTNLGALTGALLVLGERLGTTTSLSLLHAGGLALVPVAAAMAAGGLIVTSEPPVRQ